MPAITADPVPCELDARAIDQLKDQAGGPDATWSDALALGEALAAALLPPVVSNALNLAITQAQAAPAEGVRIRLILTGSELNNLPWEFAVFNRAGGESTISDFLALLPQVSLVRYPVATALAAWRIAAKAPAKVLVAVASPSNLTKLNVAAERDLVIQALGDSTLFTVSGVAHAQRGQLPHRDNPAHIFHFAGHGTFDEQPSAQPGAYQGTGSIFVEDDYGDADRLEAGQLAIQLRDAGVRVAVLGACETAERDDLQAWSSVAEALLKADVGAVVAMQFPVRDISALRFAQRFYGSLALGLSIDEATTAGRVAIAEMTPEDARGWATPVLYLHTPDGVIFPEFLADPALDSERAQARTRARLEIDSLKGKATNIRIGEMGGGAVDADARVKVVEASGILQNVVIDTLGGGAVEATLEIDAIEGEATNVFIDQFRSEGAAVDSQTKAREVRGGGSLTGVKIGTLGAGGRGPRSKPRPTKAKPPRVPDHSPE
ncbi:MAG TPA: CHAT domain-containing protein, partial [Lamprocystis sp. (in: g-proteobacteria)]|nr:CHAT domain-containing protein [Lamprocystis sp. (in: g-proteobacteria)]